MANSTIENEVKRAMANGAKVSNDGWTGAVRSLEDPTFQIGDEFTFPAKWEKKDILEGRFGKFTHITTNTGAVKQWFPGTLTKRREICEKDSNGFVIGTGKFDQNDGDVAEFYQKFAENNEAMNALCNKTVRVTDKRTHKVADFNDPTRLRNSIFYTFEFVENAKK